MVLYAEPIEQKVEPRRPVDTTHHLRAYAPQDVRPCGGLETDPALYAGHDPRALAWRRGLFAGLFHERTHAYSA